MLRGNSEIELAASGIDGLVRRQLDRKKARISVVMSFMLDFDLLTENSQETTSLTDMDIKLALAVTVLEFHEQLKYEY